MKKDFKGVVDRIKNRIQPDQHIYIKKNLSISHQISFLLEQKGWTQKEFAKRLEKEPSEVNKWLSGLHNITLKSISKMEAVVGEDIILTPLEACDKYNEIHYIVFTVYARSNEDSTKSDTQYYENAFVKVKNVKPQVA